MKLSVTMERVAKHKSQNGKSYFLYQDDPIHIYCSASSSFIYCCGTCTLLLSGLPWFIIHGFFWTVQWFELSPPLFFLRALGFSDVSDLMKTLNQRVDTSTTFSICVTREGIVERGLKQWQRQKRSSPQNPLRVTFIGEPGIDNGALKNEFLTGIFLPLFVL